ncbi:MAG: BACON domain-containing protein [Bacteroidales bacterium]|nr:BACON domain-containing protein [Bacteroidales bacterium]
MKKIQLIVASGLTLMALAGCQSTVKEIEKEVEKPVGLSIDATVIGVGAAGGEKVISFTANEAWTLSTADNWITPDKTSGEAGKAEVKLTVAPLEGDARTGKVTIKAGSTTTEFTVEQSPVAEFTNGNGINISAAAQDIMIPFSTNVADYTVTITENTPWLTVSSTKAAIDGIITIHAAANNTLSPRIGGFTIAAAGYTSAYVVVQDSEFIPASEASAVWLGSAQDPYNEEAGAYNNFYQFAITLGIADGDTVVLAINTEEPEDTQVVPEGEYEVDAAAIYKPGTFSVKSTGGNEKYYTTLFVGDKEIAIIDGEITIEKTDGGYAISALLMDALEEIHSYSYEGELIVTDESLSAENTDLQYIGDYSTHFANMVNDEWKFTFYASQGVAAGDSYPVRGFNVTVFTEKGVTVPEGEFKYEAPADDPTSTYAHGNMLVNPGTFYNLSFYAAYEHVPGVYVSNELKEGTTPKFSIEPQDDGRYTVKVSATIVQTVEVDEVDEDGNTVYDDDWNAVVISLDTYEIPFEQTYINVTLAEPVPNSYYTVFEDGDYTVKGEIMNSYLMPRWGGKAFNDDCHLFVFGFLAIDGNWNVYLAVNIEQEYEFENNFPPTAANPRYCGTPFQYGHYEFSATAAKNALLPVKGWHRIINAYSGTTFQVVGGSIDIDNTSITYDLVGKNAAGKTITFKGTHASTFYYMMNTSTTTYTLDEI